MFIQCPKCLFAKDIDPAKIPSGVKEIKCPKCATLFPFTKTSNDVKPSVAPPVSAAAAPPPKPAQGKYASAEKIEFPDLPYNLVFHGVGAELFKIYLVNILLFIITFGIYRPWGKVKLRKYLYSHTALLGERFNYTGTGRELFKGLILGGIIFFGPVFLLQKLGQFVNFAFVFLVYPYLGAVIPPLLVFSRRYRANRSVWRGVRFSFTGDWKESLKIYALGYLLTIFTFGVYYPWFYAKKQMFWRGNTGFGSVNFKYTGKGKELLKTFLLGYFLIVITFGIYALWLKAKLARYDWEHTTFQDISFKSTITGGSLFVLYFVNTLITGVTLGIAYPWTVVRTMNYTFGNLMLKGKGDFDKVLQTSGTASAIGEGVADHLDVDLAM
ncbi:MAG: zinc-ribbon domain-containing protein [Deltaproteobacteria bacterium]|nr:zinc-ribbon domain-containing protein [Deltaproteobacteria bacterium]